MNRALILFSGGVDSLLCAALARESGLTPVGLHFGYGQRAALSESLAATRLAAALRMDLEGMELPGLPGSSLTGEGSDLDGPGVVVPARNTLFLAFALVHAERIGAGSVWIGCNADDRTLFPDCRPEYLHAAYRLYQLASGGRVALRYPLVLQTKREIVAECRQRGLPLDRAWSCYAGGPQPCGVCLSCKDLAGAQDA